MITPAPGRRRTRLTLVALGLLVLLAIVAFSSRSGFSAHAHAKPTGDYVSYAFTVFLILFVLAIPVAVYAFFLQAREKEVRQKSYKARLISNVRMLVVFGIVFYAVLYAKQHHKHFFDLSGLNGKRGSSGALHHTTPAQHAAYEPTFQWTVLWIVLGLAAIGGAIFVYRWRTRGRRLPAVAERQPTVAEDFAASIGDAISDLEAEPDARRAVIAAYARMEGVLTRNGLRRRASETSVEYLERILLGLTARADAVTRLTALFQEAKFSRHEIDGTMKQDAIAALREIRDDLQDPAT
jgi:Domain of unknown function (DUF4129)